MIIKIYKKVYICHPYAGDVEDNIQKVLNITKVITEENKKKYDEAVRHEERLSKVVSDTQSQEVNLLVPVAVHLLFPKFMSEETFGREIAMDFCLEVLRDCDEIWVYGPDVSAGMRQEITYSGEHGVKVVWKNFD